MVASFLTIKSNYALCCACSAMYELLKPNQATLRQHLHTLVSTRNSDWEWRTPSSLHRCYVPICIQKMPLHALGTNWIQWHVNEARVRGHTPRDTFGVCMGHYKISFSISGVEEFTRDFFDGRWLPRSWRTGMTLTTFECRSTPTICFSSTTNSLYTGSRVMCTGDFRGLGLLICFQGSIYASGTIVKQIVSKESVDCSICMFHIDDATFVMF
jgi:hypothetical protein